MNLAPTEVQVSRATLYHPLTQKDAIRLLKLSNHALEADMSLELTEHTLSSNQLPTFLGLSYCWGSPERTQDTIVNGSFLKISATLQRGLRELSSLEEFDGMHFWIDQICVNQDDLNERSHQVNLMGKIYRMAAYTVVWLASALDSPNIPQTHIRGWQLAEKLHTLGHSQPDWSREVPFLRAPYPLERGFTASTLSSSGLPAINDISWQELRCIFDNPWFSRIWVLQEAALSQSPAKVVYGGRIQSLEHIFWSGAWFWQAEGPLDLLDFPRGALSNIHAMFIIAMSAIPWRIEPLLMGTDKLEASDTRDKIIGLLGLAAPESMPRSWAPDYHHSTATDIYRDATRAVVKESGKLLIFEGINYKCGPMYNEPPNLPSWVPRIHDVWPPVAATRLGKDQAGNAAQLWIEGYNACRDRPAQILTQDDPNILPLRGIKIDQVEWASHVLKNEEEEFRLFRWIEEGINQINYETASSSDEFIHTFFQAAARARYISSVPTIPDLQAYMTQYGDKIPYRDAIDSLLSHHAIDSNAQSDAQKVHALERNMMRITNFFMTKSGKIGFGPRWTTKGDIIAVTYGFEAPFALRQVEGKYLLLGATYIPDWMQGEAIDLQEKGILDEEWFWLT